MIALAVFWRLRCLYAVPPPPGAFVLAGFPLALVAAWWGIRPATVDPFDVATIGQWAAVAVAAIGAFIGLVWQPRGAWKAWQPLAFYFFPAMSGVALATAITENVVHALLYMAACAGSGMLFGVVGRRRASWPGAERWAEGLAGGVVVGGLALL